MERLPGTDGFIVRGVLTPEQCNEWIADAETAGFEKNGQRTTFAGARERAVMTDAKKAELLWDALKPHLGPRTHEKDYVCSFTGDHEPESGTYEPVRISDFLRFSRYSAGGHFRPHIDTCYAKNASDVGLMTILVYLDASAYQGGETVVYDRRESPITVVPETGMALVFYHYLPHAGNVVRSGTKHVVRSEVVYSRVTDDKNPCVDVGADGSI